MTSQCTEKATKKNVLIIVNINTHVNYPQNRLQTNGLRTKIVFLKIAHLQKINKIINYPDHHFFIFSQSVTCYP